MKTLLKMNLFFSCLVLLLCLGIATLGYGQALIVRAPSPEGMELIPVGAFRMGSNTGDPDEKPVHSVYVDAFYMDKYEVTNAEYAEFLNATGKHAEAGHEWKIVNFGHEIVYVNGIYGVARGYENHPVIYVSWYGAMAYAAWKRKRLPTEAEWEKAARGGLAGLNYPWGNSIDSTKANYKSDRKVYGRDIGPLPKAVGRYAANRYGLHDMSGNVREWCLDEYNADFYQVSPSQNPVSGANRVQSILNNYSTLNEYKPRVARSGASDSHAFNVRVAGRTAYISSAKNFDTGFRCVRPVSP